MIFGMTLEERVTIKLILEMTGVESLKKFL